MDDMKKTYIRLRAPRNTRMVNVDTPNDDSSLLHKYALQVKKNIEETPGNQKEYSDMVYSLLKKYGHLCANKKTEDDAKIAFFDLKREFRECLLEGKNNNPRNISFNERTKIVVRQKIYMGTIAPKEKVSRKLSNIIITIDQKQMLRDAISLAKDALTSNSSLSLILTCLSLLCIVGTLYKATTIKLSDDDVNAILFMCNKGSFDEETAIPISEVSFSMDTLEKLKRIRSLKTIGSGEETKVYLAEKVYISSY